MTTHLRSLTRYPAWWAVSTTLKISFVAHYLFSHIGTIALTDGPSMVPTMSVRGDWYYISNFNRRGRDVKVGDVISYKHPLVEGAEAIKRVLGMPGDFVCTGEKEGRMIQVPEGHCWLLGDNLPESRDSRLYGAVPLALVQGKVVARVWPLGEMDWMRNMLQRPQEDA